MNYQNWIALGDEMPPAFVWIWAQLADGSQWRGYWTGHAFAVGLSRVEVTHWRPYSL